MKISSFRDDPLLFGDEDYKSNTTINQLLDESFPIFLKEDRLNLYSTLVKTYDFKKTLSSHCFCSISTDKIKEYLPSSYKKKEFLKFREEAGRYARKKNILAKSARKWVENDIWPLLTLRVISNHYEDNLAVLGNLLGSVDYFTDSTHRSKFKPPTTRSQILTKEQAYFSGCALGDGGFSANDYWVIVDGGKEDELNYSHKWLEKISSFINQRYGIEFTDNNPRRRDNKLELWVSNKWFQRFINFWFSLPYGKKKDRIEKPKIFKLSKRPKYLYKNFWRGVFDADGYCSKKYMRASLSSGTSKILEQCKSDLEKEEIQAHIIKPRSLKIESKFFKKFGKEIGFSHPRKRETLLQRLEEGPKETRFRGISSEKLINENIFDLTHIENLRIYGFKEDIRKIRKELGLTQQELSKKLDMSPHQVYYWEKGCGVQFDALVDLYKYKGVKKHELLNLISEKDVSWGLSGRGLLSNLVKLPVKVNEDIVNLAQHLRPYTSEVRIRKTGHSKEIMEKMEETFGTKVKKLRENVYYLGSQVLVKFFEEFFEYSPYWEPLEEDQLDKLKEKLRINL